MSELQNAGEPSSASASCRKSALLIFAAAVFAFGSNAHALTEREIVAIAVRDNPRLKAAHATWEMMKARVPQARAWQDVRASGEFRTERSVPMAPNTMMDSMLMIEQELPLSGKNLSRGRAATAEAFAAFEDLRRAQLDTVMKARTGYARWANAFAQLEVNRRAGDLLGQFVQISRSRYEAGTATQPDVLIAQTDTARLLEMRADLERQVSEAETALNVLLNRPAQQSLGRPDSLVMRDEPLSLTRLQALAIANRPELQRAQRKAEAEKARLQLANRQWFPDPALSVKAQRYNGAAEAVSEVDVGVSVPIPWMNWRKYSAGAFEARKSLEASEEELEAARTETLGLVRDQLKKVQTSASQYRIYTDQILPLARQSVESSRAGYESNTNGFLELVTARRTLQDAESAALNHLANYEIALAELDALVGRETLHLSGGKE